MNSYRIILIIGICIIVALIVGGTLLWWPKVLAYQELRTQLKSEDAALKDKEEYYSNLSDMLDEVKGYPEEISKIESAFPADFDIEMPTFFDFLLRTSSENGLILDRVGGGSATSLKKNEIGVEEMSFSFSVSGSYSAFKNFLSALYKNVRMIDIESIKLSSSKDGKDIFSFGVSLKTYFNTGTTDQSAGSTGGPQIPQKR